MPEICYWLPCGPQDQDSAPINAFDGDLGNSVNAGWNSGAFPPGWIEVNLGEFFNISSVNLVVSQFPSPEFSLYEIWLSDSPIQDDLSGAVLATTVSGVTSDFDFLTVDLPSTISAQYVQIRTLVHPDAVEPSWVAWFEVQVYGTATDRDVPADDCTLESGGCNPTGLHEIVLPDDFVVPSGGTITQSTMSFVDPRADENGRCDGQTPLVLFDGDVIIPPYLCGSPEFIGILTEANFDITEGTLSHAVFPENFVSNPFECTLPIVGDPQLQSAFVWQPTDSADVIEGTAIELTNDCGRSRGKTRGLSYFFVGLHIDFGLNFDDDPRAVTQAFADLTTTKLNSLVISVVHARPALKLTNFLKLFLLARTAEVLHRNGKYIAARRVLATFIHLTERTPFDKRVSINHEGNLLSRADNIRFLLDEFIAPFAR